MGCGASSSSGDDAQGRNVDANGSTDEALTEMELKYRQKKLLEGGEAGGAARSGVSISSNAILCIAFDANEQLVLSGADNGDLSCRDFEKGELVWVCRRAHAGAIATLDVTHKREVKTRALSGGRDGKVFIWDIETGQKLFVLAGHVMPVNAVTLTPDDARIFSASSDKRVVAWDHRTRRQVADLDAHASAVWSLAVTNDGKFLFSGAEDCVIIQWTLSEAGATLLRKLEGHSGPIFVLLPSRDGDHLFSVARDRTLRQWNVRTGAVTGCFSNDTKAVTTLALSRDGGKVFLGSSGLYVVDMAAHRGDRVGADEALVDGLITAVAMAQDNLHLGIGTAAGHFVKVDVSDFVRPEQLGFHRGTVTALALSSDAALVAAASEDTTITVWSCASGRLLHRFDGHASRVWGVAFCACNDGSREAEVASASEDSTVRVWSLLSGRCVAVLRGHVGCVWAVRSPEAGHLLSCGDDNCVRLWRCSLPEWKLAKETVMRHTSPVVSLAVSNGLAASGSFDNSVKCWSLDTATEIVTLEGHTEVVWAVAFGEGNTIISGSEDGRICVWTLPLGELLSQFSVGVPIGVLIRHPTQQSIIAGCSNGDLWVLRIPLEANGDDAAAARARPFDPGEQQVSVMQNAHEGSVCALAACEQCIISGSVDMSVKYWSAKKRPPPEFKVVYDIS